MLKPLKLRERERGRRAFVLANGPSVLEHDLSRLRGELVIGMNASPLLEREHGFASAYYAVSDRRFLTHPEKRGLAVDGAAAGAVRVLRSELAADDDPALRDRTAYVRPLGRDGFSWNLAAGYYFGCTTTMLALQLAAYLGCRDIYLLGVDLRYDAERPRFYAESVPQAEDGFTSVQIWNIAQAARQLRRRGVNLAGCSPRSYLRPYLPFVPFEALFQFAVPDRPQAPTVAESIR